MAAASHAAPRFAPHAKASEERWHPHNAAEARHHATTRDADMHVSSLYARNEHKFIRQLHSSVRVRQHESVFAWGAGILICVNRGTPQVLDGVFSAAGEGGGGKWYVPLYLTIRLCVLVCCIVPAPPYLYQHALDGALHPASEHALAKTVGMYGAMIHAVPAAEYATHGISDLECAYMTAMEGGEGALVSRAARIG